MGLGFLLSTGEDVKQLNGSVFGNIAKIEDRLGKFDSVANDMANKCNAVTKRSDSLTKELEAARANTESKLGSLVRDFEAVRAKTEAKLDTRVHTADLERIHALGRQTRPG